MSVEWEMPGEVCFLVEIPLTWLRRTHTLPSKAHPFGWSYTAKPSRVHFILSPGGNSTMWAANTDKLKHLWKWKVILYEHNDRVWWCLYCGICQQDRQCTYSVTLRRVRATIVAVEKQWVLLIVSVYSLRYPACNAHAPYCNLWPTSLYNILPHFLTNDTIYEKVTEH
jgi:hypothetical protein